ncbi:extracellular solute-binding protein [Paenibacillus thalictri]|uniref:Extracellular solute-binding protein n=1 Tax=Paenibacillus thalictri TaxID=2527873 RepID=A0A4Q9DIF1_9BACL|nr:extracellular solute-binding protein [Paenibacillus thalictri]TBL72395.1 extracellular solute-binding protein [Paenibacillus thalictri]
MKLKLQQKQVLALSTVVLLSAGVLGCSKEAAPEAKPAANANKVDPSAFPIVKDKVTLKGFARKDAQLGDYAQMALWKQVEEKTNIHVDWTTPALQDATEKVNLAIASGDLPDFFIKGVIPQDDVIKYGSQGILIPLEKLIDGYAPNLKALLAKKPEMKAAITAPDGHIYALPRIIDYDLIGIPRFPMLNMTWTTKVGMQVPKTSDDLYQLLKAFKEKDPNGSGSADEIPYSAHNLDWAMRGLEGMFGLERNLDYYTNVDSANKLHIWVTDDKYKQLLQYAHKLYAEGLMDKEIFTQTDQLYFGKLAANRVGFTPLLTAQNAGKFAKDYKGITPLKGPDGDQLWNMRQDPNTGGAKAAITKANKNPEATMRLLDYFYGDEGATLLYMGGQEGDTYTKAGDGTLHYKPEILNSQKGFAVEVGARTIWPGGMEFGYYTEKQLSPMMEGTTRPDDFKTVKDYITKNHHSMPLLAKEKQDQINGLRTDIDTYIKEMQAKFIIGDASFDTWDKYKDTLKKMGIDKLEAQYQDALNTLVKK